MNGKFALLAERDDLIDKLTKLQEFISTEKFFELPYPVKDLMGRQVYYMAGYLLCLKQRMQILGIE
jgi:hypothetical protein